MYSPLYSFSFVSRFQESDYIISNDAGDDDQTEDEDDDEPPNLADQLDQFRSQWHQELSRKLDGSDHITSDTDEQSVEERVSILSVLQRYVIGHCRLNIKT